jgi:probable HAF family extracellular repeat protein
MYATPTRSRVTGIRSAPSSMLALVCRSGRAWLALVLLAPTAVAAPIGYRVTGLEAPPGEFTSSFALGINEAGQVVGASRTLAGNLRATLWDSSGSPIDLGTLGGPYSEALAINNAGAIVGASYLLPGGPQRGFLYQNGQMTDVGGISADDINDSGEIVRQGEFPFFMDSGNYGINDAGDAVGGRSLASGGQITDLGTLGGFFTDAYDINELGDVVGRSAPRGPVGTGPRAFLYRDGVMYDLGTLTSRDYSTAYAINDEGVIVGDAAAEDGTLHAFGYFGSGALVDLNTLIDPTSGWILESGRDLNNFGQIVGIGTFNGVYRGFRLDPITSVPAPSSLLIAIAAISCFFRASRSRQRVGAIPFPRRSGSS